MKFEFEQMQRGMLGMGDSLKLVATEKGEAGFLQNLAMLFYSNPGANGVSQIVTTRNQHKMRLVVNDGVLLCGSMSACHISGKRQDISIAVGIPPVEPVGIA